MVIGSMEIFKMKKCVIVRAQWRVETGTNCVINQVSETWDDMGFGVWVS